jgi:tetratricopeptide (TPR) repeat protein
MERHEKALGIFKEIGDQIGQADSLQKIGLVMAEGRDKVQALECLGRSLDMQKELGYDALRCGTLCGMAGIKAQLGQPAQARKDIEESLAFSIEMKSVADEARCHRTCGLLYWKEGELGKAREHFEKAVKLCEDRKARLGLAHALFDYGRMLKASGGRESARSCMQESRALFGEMGLDYWVKRIDGYQSTDEHK